jgi:hypothetical protein
MSYNQQFRVTSSSEPLYLVGCSNATYLAKIGGGTVASIAELLTVLAPGAMGIVTDNDILVLTSTTAANMIGASKFKIYYKRSDGILRETCWIQRDTASRISKATVAGVAQVTVLGGNALAELALPVATAAGDEVTVMITDRTVPEVSSTKLKTYSVVLKGGETANAAILRLVAMINADSERIVNVTTQLDAGSVSGLNFTAISIGTLFNVGSDGILANAKRSNDGTESSVVHVAGVGLYNQMKDLELDANVTLGGAFLGTAPAGQYFSAPSIIDEMIPTKVDTATGLATYTIRTRNKVTDVFNREGSIATVVLAFVPATAVLTSWNTIAGNIFLVPEEDFS